MTQPVGDDRVWLLRALQSEAHEKMSLCNGDIVMGHGSASNGSVTGLRNGAHRFFRYSSVTLPLLFRYAGRVNAKEKGVSSVHVIKT